MKKTIIFAFLILNFVAAQGQQTSPVKIIFTPVFSQQELVMEKHFYNLNKNDSIKFQTLKFYISDVQLLNNDDLVFKESESYHLIDASALRSFLLNIPANSFAPIVYNKIKFNLGIDSITCVSGAMGGDLDPTKAMYWTWQSGYINFKLEGISNLCLMPNHAFQFHLGGYQQPFNSLQSIQLTVTPGETISVYLDLKKFIDTIDLSKLNHVMSPNKDAVYLSESVAQCFYTQQQ